MKTSFVVLAILASLSAFGCRSRDQTFAQSDGRTAWVLEKMSDELNLTDTQKASVNRIAVEVLAKREQFKNMYQGLADDVLGQIKNDKVDQDALNKSFQEKEQQFKELRSFLISKFSDFHGTLTPEQRTKLAVRMEQYRKHRE